MVLTCAACGSINADTGALCWNCAAAIDPSPAPAAPTQAVATPIAAPGPPAGRLCPDPVCGEDNSPGTDACDYCGTPLTDAAAGATIAFTDGTKVPVLDGQVLELGRESPNGQVAAALVGAGGVSRRHATLMLRAGVLTVADQDSLNGTYVDGIQIRPARDVPLRPLILRLGQSYHVTVTPIEKADP